ncbi:formate/nitrite transporter family protein [Viridibacterium curvum]|uniref:Formate/nitrite transporter family protein n=1 Tax=Viridibacterium curvum TaxID=1101404 RepID=A0ABP9Q9T7_9RHOO
MDIEPIEKVARAGVSKAALMVNDLPRYILRCVLAGLYLSIVVLVYWCLIENLHGSPFGKVLASAFFGVGLSVIVFTQSELFTSNNMYLAVSSAGGRTLWRQAWWLWGICWVGNLIGALLLCVLLVGAGVLAELPASHALHAGALHKAHQGALAIFSKGILANWVVCLAVWVAMRVKEDLTRIVVMILVVFIFLYLGFEHSIANMGTFSMSMLGQGTLTLGDAVFNLLFSTLGNIVGGAVFVGLAYQFLEAPKASDTASRATVTEAAGEPQGPLIRQTR